MKYSRMRAQRLDSMKTFNKYKLYSLAVQNAEFDFEFLNQEFKKYRGRDPLSLREDFCGAGYLCCEWVKQGPKHTAIGIDLSLKTIQNGKKIFFKPLSENEQKRVCFRSQDVLHSHGIKADIIIAFNFSYWVFRERQQLLKYFKAVRSSMKKDSLFFLDTKGGTEITTVGTESKRHRDFTYYWECESFNPINRECFYSIHFKPKGKPRRKRVFTYHWRYWSIPEIRELLKEAGFSKSIVYMEGEDENGEGDGNFEPTKKAEDCATWVAYIAALP